MPRFPCKVYVLVSNLFGHFKFANGLLATTICGTREAVGTPANWKVKEPTSCSLKSSASLVRQEGRKIMGLMVAPRAMNFTKLILCIIMRYQARYSTVEAISPCSSTPLKRCPPWPRSFRMTTLQDPSNVRRNSELAGLLVPETGSYLLSCTVCSVSNTVRIIFGHLR